MPIGHERNDSMFPPAPFNMKKFVHECSRLYGVLPQPHWVTTYYGGYVSFLPCIYHHFHKLIFHISIENDYI